MLCAEIVAILRRRSARIVFASLWVTFTYAKWMRLSPQLPMILFKTTGGTYRGPGGAPNISLFIIR